MRLKICDKEVKVWADFCDCHDPVIVAASFLPVFALDVECNATAANQC